MYESPIKLLFPRFDDVISDMAKKQEDMVFDAVARFGVIVDKGELLRALHYDRDKYDKGFVDGKAAAMDELVRCEVCKHWCRNAGIADSPNGHCFCHDIETNGQDFCSYGEKEKR
jgi:uncharacterized Fe-S radical SAM superfamily protein PflX